MTNVLAPGSVMVRTSRRGWKEKTTVTRGSTKRGFKGWQSRCHHGDDPQSRNADTAKGKPSGFCRDGGGENRDTPPLGDEEAHEVTRSVKTFMESG